VGGAAIDSQRAAALAIGAIAVLYPAIPAAPVTPTRSPAFDVSCGRQGLVRSWATERRLATVDAGAAGLTAYVYDAAGRLVETVSGTGTLAVPVVPYGFTYLLGD
jgi:YD repeat-containing protein